VSIWCAIAGHRLNAERVWCNHIDNKFYRSIVCTRCHQGWNYPILGFVTEPKGCLSDPLAATE
jgi:hypothetical protein